MITKGIIGLLDWVTASTPRCLGDQVGVQKSSKVVQTALWMTLLLPCQRGYAGVDMVATKFGMCITISDPRDGSAAFCSAN